MYLKRYFLDRLDDIVAPNYRPSNMDILYTRVETKQAYQTVFHPSKQSKDLSMVLIDVGGQRELRSVLLQHTVHSVDAVVSRRNRKQLFNFVIEKKPLVILKLKLNEFQLNRIKSATKTTLFENPFLIFF